MKKNAYITGASTGIGAAFAKKLAEKYNLVIIARSEDKLKELAQSIQGDASEGVEVLVADLTKQKDIKLVQDKLTADENLGLLVNNAGFGSSGEFSELSINQELSQIQLNVVTLVRLTHAAIKNFKKRGVSGDIINVASVLAFLPTPQGATYGATKAYVKSFSEAVHEEVKPYNINVQTLCPGLTRTEFQDRAGVDKEKMPEFLWMESEQVVEESIIALQNKHAICIPGLMNRSTAALLDFAPTELTRKLSGFLFNQE
ncbi:MAG: SDR family oxidoreductase [Spirochaetota bacterium]